MTSSHAESSVGEIFGRPVSATEFDFAFKTTHLFSTSSQIPTTEAQKRSEAWKHLIFLDEAGRRNIQVPPSEVDDLIGSLMKEKGITYGSLEYAEWLKKNIGEDHKTFSKRIENLLKVKKLIEANAKTPQVLQDILNKSALKDNVRDKIMVVETNQGSFEIKLFPYAAPKAVENFITHAENGYYNGLLFHRVIKDFMIQGGDPTGTGSGGESIWNAPFEDEFNDSLRFDKKGILAMANSGPTTNGSQFFITVAPTPHLNNKHTIFGEVVSGYDVVEKISLTETVNDKPVTDQKIIKMYLKK
jgi:peptidylprolyl isomerase